VNTAINSDFHKMLGNTVAERLAASQEGLSSMELVSQIHCLIPTQTYPRHLLRRVSVIEINNIIEGVESTAVTISPIIY
jgi:hypothetical protein